MKAKPIPPTDLWDFLEEENKKYVKPPNSFTVVEYAKKFGLTHASATTRVNTLCKDGKLTYLGRYGNRHDRCYTKA